MNIKNKASQKRVCIRCSGNSYSFYMLRGFARIFMKNIGVLVRRYDVRQININSVTVLDQRFYPDEISHASDSCSSPPITSGARVFALKKIYIIYILF